ncbi:MAG TPA: hypothetical protein VF432_33310 [Thermoanaerobaculia bacterium]
MLRSASFMLHTPIDGNDDFAVYARHLEMLKELATSKFHLAADDAEALAADVLIASLRHSQSAEWLTGAMMCAVQKHLEDAG